MNNNKVQYIGKDLEAMSNALNSANWIIEEFKSYIAGDVVEVGVGVGVFLKLLNKLKITSLTGIEPAENLFDIILKDDSISNKIILINDKLEPDKHSLNNKFDTILYINVLEHIENDKKEIQKAFVSLKENGHICIFVPALQFLYSEFDKEVGHFRRYKLSELKNLLKKNDFKIVKGKYFDIFGIIPWLIVFKLLKRTLIGNQVSMYDKLLIPVIRLIENFIPIPFGKNILIVGKKINKEKKNE